MSDHFSGPAVMTDPSVDITDFYAFPSPERPGNLVLIMNVFPLATEHAYFSDVVNYRFRLRSLSQNGGVTSHGTAEHVIDVAFDDLQGGISKQTGSVTTSNGYPARFSVGETFARDGWRFFTGLASDPFFMDVEAAIGTDIAGKLSFRKEGNNTVQFRDVLSIVVEVPFAPIVEGFEGNTLMAAIAETVVARRGKPIRIERLGRPEIKNFVLQSPAHDPRTKGLELRDLYNHEDAFALSNEYRPLYESRIDANLAFFDGLDGSVAWPVGENGRHPLRDLLINDFLILDLAHPFTAGSFLEIERSMLAGRSHQSSGGRWLDDDILDEMLSLYVNGGLTERIGDGVDAPTKPASRTFPYVREPNKRTDLPMPAFMEV
ncbi:hypothetical protein ABIE89_005742 [Bradyrhizobium niftali]|uniref:DUF4331 family protein n=1 Tax=Bradyrhizobium niftali TaxID=2560055 RepID=UPI003836F26B